MAVVGESHRAVSTEITPPVWGPVASQDPEAPQALFPFRKLTANRCQSLCIDHVVKSKHQTSFFSSQNSTLDNKQAFLRPHHFHIV